MPVVGFPDVAGHRLCSRCHKWHEPDEGEMVWPDAYHWVRGARIVTAALTGDTSLQQFVCHRCLRIRRLREWILWGILFVIVGAILLSKVIGLM